MPFEEYVGGSSSGVVINRSRLSLAAVTLPLFTLLIAFVTISCSPLRAQADLGWRVSPEKINVQVGADRQLQLLDDSAQELHGAEWSVDDPAMADIRNENGRAVVHAKATGTVKITATLNRERRFREIKIWPENDKLPPGTTNWGTHPIGRELGDISAVPTAEGPNVFSLEQTAQGNTYLRGVREDGIQIWNWLMPEKTLDVDLVCGDWLGGALISANRGESYTLYTVGNDGKLRWQRTLPGIRKSHAYNREHVMNVLSQSQDGLTTKISGLDQQTGDVKFELTVPPSHEKLTNLRRSGTHLQCDSTSVTNLVPTMTSRLFVNIDNFAYVAFTESESTLATPACKDGSALRVSDVKATREEKVSLWQIHPDGTHRTTTVEQSKSTPQPFSPVPGASPTGAIIPDGLDGVLLSIRKTTATEGSTDEFVYRLNLEGDVVYRFLLPKYKGKLHDEMVLGEDNIGFATRGGTLVAFHVEDGKESWHWDSPEEIEVFAALRNGQCMVQTPSAVLVVENSTTSKKYMDGRVIMDWQGHVYRKHN
jgi:outer membrane protein assembly factor BamB